MTKHELQTLRARFWDAKVHNFQIGAAAAHVASLEALTGPMPGDGSVDHLIALVDRALNGESVGHPEVKPKAKIAKEAKPESKKAEPKSAPKPEPKAEEEPDLDF